jgi:hypothetical protein
MASTCLLPRSVEPMRIYCYGVTKINVLISEFVEI